METTCLLYALFENVFFSFGSPADLDLAGRYRNMTLRRTGRNLIRLHLPRNKAKQRRPGEKKTHTLLKYLQWDLNSDSPDRELG